MYGTYGIPLNIDSAGISLSIERRDDALVYRRQLGEENSEKLLLGSGRGSIIINPVEPLNLPRDLTPYLYLDFQRPAALAPKSSSTVFVTFPVEIGVFLKDNGEIETLDIFTLARQKYTLYGDPRNGMLCRYWSTAVATEFPRPDRLHEGVMELKLINATGSWVEVTRAVFSAFGMKLYYSDGLVAMRADMEVTGAATASTDFRDMPLEPHMSKSMELYTARKLVVLFPKFTMTDGI
jgi:uncharacterized protein